MSALSGPLVGFRVWEGTRRGLLSITRPGMLWRAGQVVQATCQDGGQHHAPAPNCHCGLHAVDSVQTARRVIRRMFWLSPSRHELVIGAVLLWGSPGIPVIRTQVKGRPGWEYRAPNAQLAFLISSPAARRIGWRQGIPVVPMESAMQIAREIGVVLDPPERMRSPLAVAVGMRLSQLWRIVIKPALDWFTPHVRAWVRHVWWIIWYGVARTLRWSWNITIATLVICIAILPFPLPMKERA